MPPAAETAEGVDDGLLGGLDGLERDGAAGVDLGGVVTFWERTNAEDRAICERQQRGLLSRHARPARYAGSEDGLHAFERLVAARYLRELSGEAR